MIYVSLSRIWNSFFLWFSRSLFARILFTCKLSSTRGGDKRINVTTYAIEVILFKNTEKDWMTFWMTRFSSSTSGGHKALFSLNLRCHLCLYLIILFGYITPRHMHYASAAVFLKACLWYFSRKLFIAFPVKYSHMCVCVYVWKCEKLFLNTRLVKVVKFSQ